VIIDSHTHAVRGADNAQEFVAEMDRLGIDMAVVTALPPAPGTPIDGGTNELIYKFVQQYPDRLIGFACVMPMDRQAPQELEYWVTEKGFKGLKLHPNIQNFAPNDPLTYPVIRKAIELDIPILYHTGPNILEWARDIYGDPILLDELAHTFPEAKIIAAHCDPLSWLPALARKHPNLYADTAVVFADRCKVIPGLGESVLTPAAPGVPPLGHKILFGSDSYPAWGLKNFARSLEPLRNLKVPDDMKRRILGETAAKLLKLETAS
jgi:predicted TIM-barrel fold metal-dependent hydrolase